MLTKKQKRNNWILTVVLLIVSLLFLFPVIWMLANSFKPDAAITADMNSMAAFIPPALNGNFFENYVSVLTNTGFVRYMCNTLFYAAILIVLGVIVNGLAGYALGKINFPFRDQWLLIIMMLLIVPTETVITIHFLIIAKAGLLNTAVGFILPIISTPFMIMMFRQNARSFPVDIIEAARIDGLSEVRIFFQMFIPTMKSTYAAAAVITFMNAWNSYLWPKVIMTDNKAMTMPMLIANLITGYVTDYGMLMCGVLFCSIPTMIVFFVLQKQFAEGITGAVK